jgi:two-component sensor histidine kinase
MAQIDVLHHLREGVFYSLRAPVTILAPKICRDLIADLMETFGLQRHAYTAKLLTSEFVTNSYLHAHDTDTVTLDVELDIRNLRVTVYDDTRAVPHAEDPPMESTSGRGLTITAALATTWGSTVTIGRIGKGVWFEIALQGAFNRVSGGSTGC